MPTKFLQPGESSEDQKGDLDLNLVELLIDGEGDAGFNVAVDMILHPGTVDPPNRLQLGNKSRVRIHNYNPGSRVWTIDLHDKNKSKFKDQGLLP